MRIATRLSVLLLLALTALAFGAPAASEYRLAGPVPPANIDATQGDHTDHIRVSWDWVNGASHYKVYRSMTTSFSYTVPYATVTSLYYDDPVTNANYKYYYKVRACNPIYNCGNPILETAVGWVRPDRPSYISATDGTYTNKVRVTWGTVSDATGYRVYRGTNSQGYSTSTLVGGQTSYYWDEGNITPGLKYYWWVAAYNANTGALSSMRGYDRGYRALSAPADFGATDGAYCDKTRLLWDSVVGASSYTIERATSQYGSYGTIAPSVAALSYNDTTGTPSQIYYYRVRAKASDPEVNPSLPSNADSGFRGIPPRPIGHLCHRWHHRRPGQHPLGRAHRRHLLSALSRHQPQLCRIASGLYPGHQL